MNEYALLSGLDNEILFVILGYVHILVSREQIVLL